VDEETLEIILAAAAVGIDSIQDVARALREVENRMLQLTVVTAGLMEATLANAAAQEVAKKATNDNADANQKAIPFITGLLNEFDKAPFLVQVLVVALIAATTVLLPFIEAVVGATVVLTGFTAGLAGLMATVLLALGPFALLGAAFVFLADKAFQSSTQALQDQVTALGVQRDQLIAAGQWGTAQQKAYTEHVAALKVEIAGLKDPMDGFKETLSQISNTIGTAALPVVGQLSDAVAKLAPGITAAGLEALQWFQNRLPAAMKTLEAAAGPVGDAVRRMAVSWGTFFDEVTARFPQIGPVAQKGLDILVGAVDGLLRNLIRLTDWFIKELPTMGPVVGQIFSWIGEHIQDLADIVAHLVDFFINHWPEITKNVQTTWDSIVRGWTQIEPTLKVELPLALQLVAMMFQFMDQHGELTIRMLEALGATLVLSIVVLTLFYTAVVVVTTAVSQLFEWFQRVWQAIVNFEQLIEGSLIGNIGKLAGILGAAASAAASLAGWLGRIPGLADAAAAHQAHVDWSQGSISGGGGGSAGGPMLTFATGGIVPGPVGAPQLAVVHGGEAVLTPEQRAAGGGGDVTLVLNNEVLGRYVDGRINAYFGRMQR